MKKVTKYELLEVLLALIFFGFMAIHIQNPLHYAFLGFLFIAHGICCEIARLEKLVSKHE